MLLQQKVCGEYGVAVHHMARLVTASAVPAFYYCRCLQVFGGMGTRFSVCNV